MGQEPPPTSRAALSTEARRVTEGQFVDYGRWLLDWEWRRADAYERKASYMLAFSGVLLAVLPLAADRTLTLKGHPHIVVVWSLLFTAISLLGSGLAAALALQRRKVKGFPIAYTRDQWSRWRANDPTVQKLLLDSMAETIWRANAAKVGPLATLARDADRRGTYFALSIWGALGGIIGLAVPGYLRPLGMIV